MVSLVDLISRRDGRKNDNEAISKLDCVMRTAVVAMSDGGGGGGGRGEGGRRGRGGGGGRRGEGGGGGVLSSNFVHQMCHQGGGRGCP